MRSYRDDFVRYHLSALYHPLKAMLRTVPRSAEEAKNSAIFNEWYYYSVELFPGVIKRGIYPDYLPMLPRMLLRNCDLRNADCLDIGSMEGLIPVLMCKQGARNVLATDFNFHCYQKMRALMAAHGVNFDFKRIGTLYDLDKKIPNRRLRGFDLINLSGVLYHVFSPLHVLAGLRPLLKQGGLMIVSTNVINRDDYSMEFNNSGKLQSEANTFWYVSIHALDYMLRYFQLAPIDCVYYEFPGTNIGYFAAVCRAISDRGAQFKDQWLSNSIAQSWEYLLCNQTMLESQDVSAIRYRGDNGPINLAEKNSQTAPVGAAIHSHDTHLLKLADTL